MTLLLFYLFLAIGVSFLCSILEAVLLSLTPSFISARKESGERAGKLLDQLKRDVDRPLAAILSLNTIAHTVGAAGVGAQAQVVFQSIPVSVISGVLTLLILVLSEIIPKTLGANQWRTLAVPSAYTIWVLTYAMWPLVILSQGIARLLTPRDGAATISREEIQAMADLGHQEGVLDRADADALRGVFEFQNLKVADVLTPRTVTAYLAPETSIDQVMDREDGLNFSRYPVLDQGDRILGYALKADILTAAAMGERERKIQEFARKVLIIPDTMPLKRAFGLFLRQREHLAVVVDEFGSFAGVVTLEDALESLIGREIMDEADGVEDLRELARQSTPNQTTDNAPYKTGDET